MSASVAFDYVKSASTALRLLTKFGQKATLRRQTQSKYDAATSKATSSGVEEECTAALLAYSPYVVATSNGTIRQEDQRVLLATEGVKSDPKPMDEIDIGNKTYTIHNVNAVSPAGVVVLYDMQVRR